MATFSHKTRLSKPAFQNHAFICAEKNAYTVAKIVREIYFIYLFFCK